MNSDLSSLGNPANLVTVGRLAISPLLFWLILDAPDGSGASWWGFAVGMVLGASDAWDGRLARNSGRQTRLGAFLDPLADKVMVLGAMFCFASLGRFGWVPVGLITAREAAISVYRIGIARSGLVLPARYSAKWKTIVQGLPLTAAILPPLVGVGVIVPLLLWIAVAMTYLTGFQYLLDVRAAGSGGETLKSPVGEHPVGEHRLEGGSTGEV